MRRPRTVEITNNRLVIDGLDISGMITASSPDVFSFKGIALVDDPRLHTRIGRHEVNGIERLRRRLADHSKPPVEEGGFTD